MDWKNCRLSLSFRIKSFPICSSFSILLSLSILLFYLYFSFLATVTNSSSSTSPTSLDFRSPFSGKTDQCYKSNKDVAKRSLNEEKMEQLVAFNLARRLLSGPGSSPPRCTSKCGRCTPCKPVHVPVPPGTPVTAEYYPEAWRCKCGNKLYMP